MGVLVPSNASATIDVETSISRRRIAFSRTMRAWYSMFAAVGTTSTRKPMYSLPPDASSSPRRDSSSEIVSGSTTLPRSVIDTIARKMRRCFSA